MKNSKDYNNKELDFFQPLIFCQGDNFIVEKYCAVLLLTTNFIIIGTPKHSQCMSEIIAKACNEASIYKQASVVSCSFFNFTVIFTTVMFFLFQDLT